jgi:NitT/TauT family transport system ATP-binding protein
MPHALHCRRVSHGFGKKTVLYDVNLDVPRGQFLSLVGPSGCGKSTLLRAIVGTHLPRQGEILIGRGSHSSPKLVTGPGRDRGIVYQHYSLFPFLTAQENVAVGLMLDQTSLWFRLLQWPRWRRLRKQHLDEAAAMLARVKLGESLRLYPHEMSGGMRQRVALAQALIMKPEIILLDEPFGALDEATREGLQRLLLALHDENTSSVQAGQPPPFTLIIVTHELNEALLVGDRVAGLSQYWDWGAEGHQCCPGATVIYDQPAPFFKPTQAKELEAFGTQREQILQIVFDPNARAPRGQHLAASSPASDGRLARPARAESPP